MTRPFTAEDIAAWIKRVENLSAACDPECEGRCRVCPETVISEARDMLTSYAASLAARSSWVPPLADRIEEVLEWCRTFEPWGLPGPTTGDLCSWCHAESNEGRHRSNCPKRIVELMLRPE